MNWKKFTLGALLGFVGFMCLAAGPTGLGTRQIYTDVPVAINLSSVAAKEGSSPAVCRADHVHSISGVVPQGSGGTGAGALTCAAGQPVTSNGSNYLCETAPVAVAYGGTNSGTALNNNRTMVSSAGAVVEAAAGTTGQCWTGVTGAAPAWATCGTSNGVTADAPLSGDGTSGNHLTFATQSPETVLSGNTEGSTSALPTFKHISLVAPWTTGTKPVTADSRDEEFQGDCGLNGSSKLTLTGWTVDTGVVSTAIDPYALFSTAGAWRFSCNGRRPGWLMIQTANSATHPYQIQKAVTLGTNDMVWARMSMNFRTLNPGSGEQSIYLVLSATSAGVPDNNNQIWITPYVSTGSLNGAQFCKDVAGVSTCTSMSGGNSVSTGNATPFGGERDSVVIQKIGTTYYGWIGTNGSWYFISSFTYAGTLDRISVQVTNSTDNTTAPGNQIAGVNFIRFQATSTGLP